MSVTLNSKNILYLYSEGGGNKITAQAAQQALQKMPQLEGAQHELKSVDDIWPAGENGFDLYNYFFVNQVNSVVNSMLAIGKALISAQKGGMVEKLKKKIDKVDLIVSVSTLITPALLEAAKEKNIPVVIICADFDPENYVYGLSENAESSDSNFKLCIAYDDPKVQANTPDFLQQNVEVIGYPVREEFLKSYSDIERSNFRDDCRTPKGADVITVMAGAQGVDTLKQAAKTIFSYPVDPSQRKSHIKKAGACASTEVILGLMAAAIAVYVFSVGYFKSLEYFGIMTGPIVLLTGGVFFCLRPKKGQPLSKRLHFTFLYGKKDENKLALENLSKEYGFEKTEDDIFVNKKSNISFNLVGFTKDVYKYFASSDGVLTLKPGPGTISEACYLGVPIILYQGQENLSWEQLNVELVKDHRLGIINDGSELILSIQNLLANKESYKQNIEKI